MAAEPLSVLFGDGGARGRVGVLSDPPLERGKRADERLRRVRLPNGETRIDVLDLAGRMLRQDLPDGTVRHYRYDDRGRLAAVGDGHREHVRYRHEPGALTAVTDNAETRMESDLDGRPVAVTQQIGDFSWTFRVGRNEAGEETAWLYPEAVGWLTLDKTTDGTRRLCCGLRRYLSIDGDQASGLTRITLANGVKVTEALRDPAAPRLRRLRIESGAAGPAKGLDFAYAHDDQGRITAAGPERFAYDAGGRLTRAEIGERAYAYRHDARGRLCGIDRPDGTTVCSYDAAPMVAAVVSAAGDPRPRFAYDRLGQRIRRAGAPGVTRYHYNLLGQLERVELPDGRWVRYLHDGFGRLVGRRTPEETRYYLVDIDGRRVAEMDARGRVTRSYLWLGMVCMGVVDGPVGRRLSRSYHRVHAGRMAAVGEGDGRLAFTSASDPFGGDAPITLTDPGFAGLFGDPETGLLLAGGRWLDPKIAQFITPDSWYGALPDRAANRRLRRALRLLPGGTERVLSPETAYQWCALDPVNAVDTNGHNWVGLIFTTISALLWQMQLTSVALQMEVLNIIFDIILVVVGIFGAFLSEGYRDFYWRWSIYNLAPPTASYRLMVPFALWLNGLMKFQPERAWTLGNIVWARGSELREIEARAQRDLVIASNAGTYSAATDVVATGNLFLVRNDATLVNATYAPGPPPQINGMALAAGGMVTDVYVQPEWILARLPGHPEDAVVQALTYVGATDMRLAQALPTAFDGQAIEVRRLDRAFIKIEGAGRRIARPIEFIVEDVIHIGPQIPEGVPTAALTITEYLPAVVPADTDVDFPAEFILLRAEFGDTHAGFAAAEVIKIEGEGVLLARRIDRLRDVREILLDVALPGGPFAGVEVTRMVAGGAPALGQSAGAGPAGIGTRITAGRLTDTRAGDGMVVANTGMPVPEPRIVTAVLLDATVTPVGAALQGVDVGIDHMVTDPGTQVPGQITGGGTSIETDPGNTARYVAGDPVRMTDGGVTLGIVDSVDAGANLIVLTANSGLADGQLITLVKLAVLRSYEAEQIAAPGDHLLIRPERASQINNGDTLRIRPAASAAGGELRQLSADPVVTVDVSEALDGGTAAGLEVQRLVADAPQLSSVAVVAVRPRLVFSPGAVPFAVGDEVLIADPTEQTIAEITEITVTGSPPVPAAVIDDPQERPTGTPVTVSRLAPTGNTTAGASLGEGLVMIPSDPSLEPTTRRRALENHEMRHVFQEALWGPFFLSMPIPWLFHLGYSFRDDASSRSKFIRHVSLGGLDSAIAGLVWTIGGSESKIRLTGLLQDDRRTVTFPEDVDAGQLARYEADARVDVTGAGGEDFNVVDSLETGGRRVILRFPASESRFPTGGEVTLVMSPFEQVRKIVNTYFSLNLEQLWADHIPTAWGRVLSKLLNRDSWFPLLGLYPLGFIFSGGDDTRSPFEQDAAFHSGDLYTDIPLSDPTEVFVGQFSRIYGFIQARFGGVAQNRAPTRLLTIQLPTGVSADAVSGSAPFGANQVRLRENWMLPLHPRVENAVAGLFAASEPGDYQLNLPNRLTEDVVLAFAMPTAFTERDHVQVRDLVVDPLLTREAFETEVVTYAIQAGDSTATYALRFPAGAAVAGQIDGLRFFAPLVTSPPTDDQDLEITATYDGGHPVFAGAGQSGPARLTADQRTNVARRFTLTIRELTVPVVGPVDAGTETAFQLPISPREAVVTSALPAGASVNARVVDGGGRPAQMTFFAPDAVNAATDVTVELHFGADPVANPAAAQRVMPLVVNVRPTP